MNNKKKLMDSFIEISTTSHVSKHSCNEHKSQGKPKKTHTAPKKDGVTKDGVAKDDLKPLTTKEDLIHIAKKEDLKPLTTKDDLVHVAKRDDLKPLTTKEDLVHVAKREDLKPLTTKDDLVSLAKRADVLGLLNRNDLIHVASKEDLKSLVTKEDLRNWVKDRSIREPEVIPKNDLTTFVTKQDILDLAKREDLAFVVKREELAHTNKIILGMHQELLQVKEKVDHQIKEYTIAITDFCNFNRSMKQGYDSLPGFLQSRMESLKQAILVEVHEAKWTDEQLRTTIKKVIRDEIKDTTEMIQRTTKIIEKMMENVPDPNEVNEEDMKPRQNVNCLVWSILCTSVMVVATYFQFYPTSNAHLYH